MLKPEIESALNQQFTWEQAASQEYLAMAAYLEGISLGGFARFMLNQSAEEREHAMKIYRHIIDRGGQVKVSALPEPPVFGSPRAVFEAARAREQANTRSIHDLYALAVEHQDYSTQSMLHWFIEEQVEEEAWCAEAMDLFDHAGDDRAALLMLDERFGRKAAEEG
jgi:ferritin